ncbi:MAG: polysaccharide biosynthesis tyrosine autokinase [Pseudomonadota bacterium]
MAKTFDALKRTEKETGVRSGVPPITPASDRRPEIPPLTVKPEGIKFSPPPLPPKFGKSKDISRTVEEYCKMKYRILNYDPDRIIKTILFCSSGKGEGNSTVLLQFAQTLTAEGYRVLLVDANLRNPTLHRLLRLERENGLTELSSGNGKNVTEVMKETALNNLWVITSGSPYPNPAAIFESDFFDPVIDQMKIQADWVLFDSPSLRSSSDSIALARKVDGVVLVVQAEKTRWEVVQESKARLEKSGGRILGVVLNKRRFQIPGWVYKRL